MTDSKQYDFSGYNTVCKMREGLQDNDPLTAYKVFTQAGIVQSYDSASANQSASSSYSDREFPPPYPAVANSAVLHLPGHSG